MSQLRFGMFGLVIAGSMAVSFGALADEPAPFSWTGFYVGSSVGAAWTNDSAKVSPADAGSEAAFGPGIAAGRLPSRYDTSGSGAIFGLQAGYNWQLQGVLVGVEADFSGTTAGGSVGTSFANGVNANNATSYASNLSSLGTVRARLGMLVTPTLLTYVTGGFAYGQVNRSYSNSFSNGITNAPLGGLAGNSRSIETGYTIGGGGEWALSNKISVGVEYLYVNLGASSFTASGATTINGCSPPVCSLNIIGSGTEDHIVRLKLNFKM